MTRIIGHRGGRSLWPENSLGGFRNLLGLPVAGVELDIHLSDAGELLVIHDPTLDRTTDATGPVRALTPQDRARVRLKNCDEGIPVLSEVLPVFADSGFEMHLEIKADAAGQPYPGLPARVLAEVDPAGPARPLRADQFQPGHPARVPGAGAGGAAAGLCPRAIGRGGGA